jgi:hypothetical protein
MPFTTLGGVSSALLLPLVPVAGVDSAHLRDVVEPPNLRQESEFEQWGRRAGLHQLQEDTEWFGPDPAREDLAVGPFLDVDEGLCVLHVRRELRQAAVTVDLRRYHHPRQGSRDAGRVVFDGRKAEVQFDHGALLGQEPSQLAQEGDWKRNWLSR